MRSLRYYSIGKTRTTPENTWEVLGWSRDHIAAVGRVGTVTVAHASSPQQAIRMAADRLGVSRDKIIDRRGCSAPRRAS